MYCFVKACITIARIMPILWIVKSVSLVNVEKTQGNSYMCNSPFYPINRKVSKQLSE